jgi:hypothetical protein
VVEAVAVVMVSDAVAAATAEASDAAEVAMVSDAAAEATAVAVIGAVATVAEIAISQAECPACGTSKSTGWGEAPASPSFYGKESYGKVGANKIRYGASLRV